jgi:hypothetical protein
MFALTLLVVLASFFRQRICLHKSIGENFDKTFSKVFRAPAAKRRSPLARGETPLSAFLFDSFFFAPPSCKEKTAKES